MLKNDFFDSTRAKEEIRHLGNTSYKLFQDTGSANLAVSRREPLVLTKLQNERTFYSRKLEGLSTSAKLVSEGRPFAASSMHYNERFSGVSGTEFCASVGAHAQTVAEASLLSVSTNFDSKTTSLLARMAGDEAEAQCRKSQRMVDQADKLHREADKILKQNAPNTGSGVKKCSITGAKVEAAEMIRAATTGGIDPEQFFSILAKAKLQGSAAQAKCQQPPPVCQRPYYESASEVFSQINGYGNYDEMSQRIGGNTARNIDGGIFRNMCTLRGSELFRALREEVKCAIPRVLGKTVSGGDGSQYFYRVRDFAEYLEQAFGPPDYDSRKKGAKVPDNVHGIIVMLWPESAPHGYTGHFKIDDYISDAPTLYWHLPSKSEAEVPVVSAEKQLEQSFAPSLNNRYSDSLSSGIRSPQALECAATGAKVEAAALYKSYTSGGSVSAKRFFSDASAAKQRGDEAQTMCLQAKGAYRDVQEADADNINKLRTISSLRKF